MVLKRGYLNVVLDAFWGSSGKGKVCDWLAATCNVTDAVSSNMPNAGHTVVRGSESRVLKALPSASVFNNVTSWLSGSSGFVKKRLAEELEWVHGNVKISDRAFAVTEEHAARERQSLSKISSTMQGSGAALCDKIMRQNHLLFDRAGVLWPDNMKIMPAQHWRTELCSKIVTGTALFEVSQGWGLSIDHGTEYPNCTSRNCNVQAALSDSACPPQVLGSVIAVIRPYPIRVGNTVDGFSGGWMPDSAEVDWNHVSRVSGLETELSEKERTTVTKRVRRVSTFSYDLLLDCVKHNGVTGVFLNFAQYIDAKCAGQRGRIHQAPDAVRIFVDSIENAVGVPVIGVGTGADTFDVLD